VKSFFHPHLTEGFGLSGLSFLRLDFLSFGPTFKAFKSERKFQVPGGTDFQEENCKLYERFLKVSLHPPPPLERESLIRIVEITLSKVVVLSILKIWM